MFTPQLSHPPTSPSLLISIYFIVLSERPPALTLAPLLENISCPGMVWKQRSRGRAPRRAWAGVEGANAVTLSSVEVPVCMGSLCPQRSRWAQPHTSLPLLPLHQGEEKKKQQRESPTRPTPSCALSLWPLYLPVPPPVLGKVFFSYEDSPSWSAVPLLE